MVNILTINNPDTFLQDGTVILGEKKHKLTKKTYAAYYNTYK